MGKRKIIFLTGAIWEIIRFALLYLLLLVLMNPSFNIIGSILLVWFGTLHFLMACCFFFLWFNQQQYSSLLPFMTLGKGLNILPALFLFIMGTGLFQIGIEFFRGTRDFGQEYAPQAAFSEGSMGFLLLFSGIILFFDLIFFFIVLSYTLNKPEEPEIQTLEHLPEWTDIHVEEE
jgi:hypothetical protein